MDEVFILALETSSRVGSVALAQGPTLLAQTTFSAPLQHSSEVFPAIRCLLDRFGRTPGDIAQVHIAIGPGSFTGLRIAVAMAKMIHLANGASIVTVDTLDTIAANIGDGSASPPLQDSGNIFVDRVATILDAKRGEFYAAVYQRTEHTRRAAETALASEGYEIPAPGDCLWRKIAPDCLITADELIERFAGEGPLGLLGDGLLYHRGKFAAGRLHILPEKYWSPQASMVHALGYQKARAGLFADALTLTPFYLRGPLVTLKSNA
jgi:tRNA threonylcarbamoyl adenosine modification protein YeaZ